MQWNHLPLPGGIYAQDPELMRRWRIIWQKKAEKEKAEDDKRKREQKRKSSSR